MLLRAQTAETRLLHHYLRLSADRYLYNLLYDVTSAALKNGATVKVACPRAQDHLCALLAGERVC
jgi:hypothetical protein